MINKICNCWIGVLKSCDRSFESDLYLDTYIQEVKRKSELWASLAGISTFFTHLLPKDYIDRRRGLSTLFNFCPWCGTKINWPLLRKKLKKGSA